MIRYIITVSILLFLSESLLGQSLIRIQNPSFTGEPTVGKMLISTNLRGWKCCGITEFPGESSFDIQPGFYKTRSTAFHGETFIGLITRENGTYESMCQKLGEKLSKDSTYQLSVHLARSENYISLSRYEIESLKKEGKNYNYNHPCVLNVWGGNSECEKVELLAQSEEIGHTDWINYTFTFTAKNDYEYLSLEAFFPDRNNFTRGNLLLDAFNSDQIYKEDSIYYGGLAAYEIVNLIREKKSSSDSSSLAIIKNIDLLNQKDGNLIHFLNETNESELASIIKATNLIGAASIHEILTKLFRIKFEKEHITEEEYEFVTNSNAVYQELIEEVSLDNYLTMYVRQNKWMIVRDILGCH